MRLKALEGDKWRFRTARNILPILVEYAKLEEPLTYKRLDEEIQNRGLGKHCLLTVYGYAAGSVARACAEYAMQKKIKVPPLNVLVVNEKAGLPGGGADMHFRQYYSRRRSIGGKWSKAKRERLYREAIKEVRAYRGWGRFLKDLGYRSRGQEPHPVWDRPKRVGASRNREGKPSAAHERVVDAVRANPGLVGLALQSRSKKEYGLLSKDRIDVFFKAVNYAVECKPVGAPADELERGVYQCIKYRAVLNAELKYLGKEEDAVCVLALGGEAPLETKYLARKLDVEIYDDIDQKLRDA